MHPSLFKITRRKVFSTSQTWVKNGFVIPRASESDFPFHDDEFIEVGMIEKRPIHEAEESSCREKNKKKIKTHL